MKFDKTTIAFDGDDTLWENERHYEDLDFAINKFLNSIHIDILKLRNIQTDILIKNIGLMGYGMKVYILSFIESFCKVYPQKSAKNIIKLIEISHPFINIPAILFPNTQNTINYLSSKYNLILITKGDLVEQNYKINSSGLKSNFNSIHIVERKNKQTYQSILENLHIKPDDFIMIGNSYNSDIKPVIELGAKAIYIPNKINPVLEKRPNHQQLSNNKIIVIPNIEDLTKLF